jgi:hypothetical protein
MTKGKTKARQGNVKDQAKARSKQRQREKAQRLAKEEGHTKAKGALLQKASREISKGLQGFREGFFPMGGFL